MNSGNISFLITNIVSFGDCLKLIFFAIHGSYLKQLEETGKTQCCPKELEHLQHEEFCALCIL